MNPILKKNSFRNERGFSLIEVLVSAGIASILALAVSAMMVSQANQVGVIANKLEKTELKSFLQQVLGSPDVCLWQLQSVAPVINLSMPTNQFSFAPAVFNLSKIYSGKDPSSPVVAEIGRGIGPGGRGMKVEGMTFSNIYKLSDESYYGSITVQFASADPKNMALAPIAVGIVFQTKSDTPLNAKTISSCSSGASAGGSPAGTLCGFGLVQADKSILPSALCDNVFPSKITITDGVGTVVGDCPSGYKALLMNWAYSCDGCTPQEQAAGMSPIEDFSGSVSCIKQ